MNRLVPTPKAPPIDEPPDEDTITSEIELQYHRDLASLTKEDRLQYAMAVYYKGKKKFVDGNVPHPPSFRAVAQIYGVDRQTLTRRYMGSTKHIQLLTYIKKSLLLQKRGAW